MMIFLLLLLALLACFGLSFFFSGSETAVISVNRFRLRSLSEQGDPEAGRLLRLLVDTQRLLITMLIGTNLANVLAALIFKQMLLHQFLPEDAVAIGVLHWSELFSLLLLTPALIIFAEILPKTIFRAHADKLARRLHPAYIACMWLFWPALWIVERIARLMLGPLTEARSRAVRRLTRQDVMQLIRPEERADERPDVPAEPAAEAARPERVPAAGGKTTMEPGVKAQVERAFEASDERLMVEHILTLHQTTAEEIMTPLVNLVAVQLGRVDLEALRALAISSGYSRLPVYRDRIVHLIGYIDVFRVLREFDGRQTIQDFIERPHYVPETKRVDDLLQEFLDLRIKNAIVVDEYGGCSGWISREDIIEEIVGELEDELDEPRELISETSEGVYAIDGTIEIEPLNNALGTEFSDENWETLAGLLLATMGRVPKVGDEVTVDGWRARVLEMDHQRIARAELARIRTSEK